MRANLIRLYAFLIMLNLGAWTLALWAFWSRPILLGTALLAYTFGLRHAVDADHISAIDNATRKLMQARKTPLGVGLYFSLGHSTVVVALTVAVATGAAVMKDRLPALQHAGTLIGTSVSAGFLLLIAAINLAILFDIFGAFARARRGETYEDFNLETKLNRRGLMGRFFAPLLRIVDQSWKMYPIGVLFGLGFDTATEVALLGIAAVEAGKGIPVADILLFPLLFTAGMSLIDTTDGILMLGAYGWAFVKPVRKLYYNAVITSISVFVAIGVGGIEATGVVADQFRLNGGIWDAVRLLNDNFGLLGFIIVAFFLASWAVSVALYKRLGYDDLSDSTGQTSRVAEPYASI
ncbi:MAG: HoxN/HupN/NixA family nickel/cobalt transporter [Candidatus Cybelea sp.]